MCIAWDDFLEKIADEYSLDTEERQAFVKMFTEKGEKRSVRQLAGILNITEPAVKKRLQHVYNKFAQACPDIERKTRVKSEILQRWLNKKYSFLSQNKTTEPSSASALAPDWQGCCRRMLPTGLTTNPLLFGDGVMLTIEDIVPLGLVERKQRPQHEGDFLPEQGSLAYTPTDYEITRSFEHNKFFEQVLEKGDSPKSQGRKIAIIGEPGAGKTTLLQETAHWLGRAGGLPIFVKLADLQGKSLEDYLLENWLKLATRKPRITQDIEDDFVDQFNAGRVWLLLDGVDEMAESDNLLSSIDRQLTGWVAAARIVLTCRLNIWDVNKNALYTFDTYRTLELTYPDMVGEFIRRFFSKAAEPTKGEKLIEKLDQSQQRLRDLVKNPLRLTLLCRTWKRRQGELPQTKAELYKRFVETFYEWKDKPEISTEKRQLLNQALGELAKRAIDEEATKFRLRETLIRKELDKFDRSLFGLARDFGWLNQVGMAAEKPDEPVYAFFHPTFQEYFAALAIPDRDFFLPRKHKDRPVVNENNSGKYKPYRIFEPQWKEVILLWLGRQEEEVSKQQKEEFIEALVKFEDGCWDFYWYRTLFLAAAGIAEFKDCIYADWIVATLVKCSAETYTDTMDERLVGEAARATLLETDRTRAVNALIDELNDFIDEDARWKVFNSLVQIGTGNSEVIAALTDLMHTSSDEELRQEAAFFLGKINLDKREAINFLKQQLLNTTLPNWLHLRTASFLGEIDRHNPDAIKYLTELINQNQGFRLEAASTLGKIAPGNQDAIKTLTKFLSTDPGECLINIPLVAACDLLQTDPDNADAIRVLSKFVEPSQKLWDRLKAASSLGKIQQGKQEAIKVLLEVIHEAINTTQDRRLLQQAGWSLKQIDPSIFEPSPNWSQKTFPGEGDVDYMTAQLAFIKHCLCQENDIALEESSYELIWYFVQTTPYPAFYQACHSQPSTTHPEAPNNIPAGSSRTVQALENQLLDIRSQLQPTDKIYPLWIDAQALEGETDKSTIAQEILNQIFLAAFPDTPEIPIVNNAAQLRSWIPRIKRRLQKQNLALILHQYEPYPELVSFCRQLASGNVLHIGWITDKPLEAPLRGFPPAQPNLRNVLQNWIDKIG